MKLMILNQNPNNFQNLFKHNKNKIYLNETTFISRKSLLLEIISSKRPNAIGEKETKTVNIRKINMDWTFKKCSSNVYFVHLKK